MTALSPAVLAAVTVGGAAGSVCRYLVAVLSGQTAGLVFPWGTFIVNGAGGLAIGVLAELMSRGSMDDALRPLLITGFLGGFTTFSAFSLEVVVLSRTAPLLALGYVLASVVLSVLACACGMLIVRVAS